MTKDDRDTQNGNVATEIDQNGTGDSILALTTDETLLDNISDSQPS